MHRHGLLALIATLFIASDCLAAMPIYTGPITEDNEISLIYNPTDGNVTVEANGQLITTFELKSESGLLTGTAAPNLVLPPFDVHTPEKFFILKTDGIGDTDLGNIAATGISFERLSADLTLSGSVLPNGGLGTPNLWTIPEPSSMGLAMIGLLGLLQIGRNRRHR